MITIGILALPNCMASSVIGPVDFFSVANASPTMVSGDNHPLIDCKLISADGQDVRSFNGRIISPDMGIDQGCRLDIVLVPVIFGDLEPLISDIRIRDWLRWQSSQGACLSSVCAGSFLLAATGLLDGRQATTHWRLATDFRLRFPNIVLKIEKMLIDEGNFITAGGVTAYMDLCLYLLARFGSPELSTSLAKTLLIDPVRRSQAPYQAYSYCKEHGDTEILRVQQWLESHITEKTTVLNMATLARLGERTLARRFKRATGDSLMEYQHHLRIDTARKLLETTAETIDCIMQKCGYEDPSSFRRLFKKITSHSPSSYRKKFSLLP
jgi:transcriptional regulator GlxA family with amidase domain